MYKSIIDFLVCPMCDGNLSIVSVSSQDDEIIDGILGCNQGHRWVIKEGVLNLGSEEQDFVNNWSTILNEENFNEMDKKINEKIPDNEKEGRKASINQLLNLIEKDQPKSILDIATGRGVLLRDLISSQSERDIICLDLSFDVLRFDRREFKNKNPKQKISFIAADATKLPFKANSIDLCVSNVGFQNMSGDKMRQSIKECIRISKHGLKDIAITIKDDNPKIDELNKLLSENNLDFDIRVFTESRTYSNHLVSDEVKTKMKKIYEGIGEHSESDLIPIEGELFSFVIYETNNIG